MSVKDVLSRVGKALSGMVMPNIGALIAWGFITALFIETGWVPNAELAQLNGPMLNYLIPVLIASQGGFIVAGARGRIMGAIAVIGCIVGAPDYPMLMAAMIIGPLAGWVIKQFDRLVRPHTKAGFEMLVDNFSVGILGMLVSIFGFFIIGPVMSALLVLLTAGVQLLTNYALIPLLALFIEPAKVLFLNNAINHGIFTPIGATQVAETGSSIMYMLEANPGPGLGVLLAYMFFSKDTKTRQSAPGAVIIHFFGGIHEIYFPYILMNPRVILAPIVGNICAISWFLFTGSGLTGPASPGSIIAFIAVTPPHMVLQVLVGVVIATAVSFAIAMPLVKTAPVAQAQGSAAQATGALKLPSVIEFGKKIIFACDAGMGSSAMGATRFRNRIKLDRPDIVVEHASVDSVPNDADLVVVQRNLYDRAKRQVPDALFVQIDNLLNDPALDQLFEVLVTTSRRDAAGGGSGALSGGTATSAVAGVATGAANGVASDVAGGVLSDIAGTAAFDIAGTAASTSSNDGSKAEPLLKEKNIALGCESVSRTQAITDCAAMLVADGAVDANYLEFMLERDRIQSVYMGMGVAIPHGTNEAKASVKHSAVVVRQYPQGVEWDGEKAYLVIGIAGTGDEHLGIIASVCEVLADEGVLQKMYTTTDVQWVFAHLSH